MLNYETLLSSYDDKLTLMQWLKKVEDALKNASAVGFSVNKKGNATISFQINFEDGTSIESGDLVLQQGESVESAYITNGHLHLVLTNGDDIDAGALFNGNITITGNVRIVGQCEPNSLTTPEIAVTTIYERAAGVGVAFSSNVNIDGNLEVSDGNVSLNDGYVSTPILTSQNAAIEAQKPVVEVMTGYTFERSTQSLDITIDYKYAGLCKNGNKLTLVLFVGLLPNTNIASGNVIPLGTFTIPSSVGSRLYGYTLGSQNNILDMKVCELRTSLTSSTSSIGYTIKPSNISLYCASRLSAALTSGTTYLLRYEVTFLLSENLAA